MKKVMSSGKWQHFKKQTAPDSYRKQFYGVKPSYDPFGVTPQSDLPAAHYEMGEVFPDFNKQANEVLARRVSRGKQHKYEKE